MHRVPAFLPALGLLALTVATPVASAQRAVLPPPDTAVMDVRLEPAEDAPRHTLIVRGGRIAAIQPADAELPPGLRHVQGDGALVLPAFFDGATGRGLTAPEPVIEQDQPLDVTSDVSIDMRLANRKGIRPAFRAAEGVEWSEDDRKAFWEQGFGYALVVPSGELLSGKSVLVAVRDAALRDSVVVGEPFAHAAFDASGSGYPSTLMGYFAQLRQFFLDTERYLELVARYNNGRPGPRPPYDHELGAGVDILSGELLVCAADEAADVRRWYRLADELGIQIAILGGREAGQVSDLLAERGTKVWLDLDWGDEVADPREEEEEEEAGEEEASGPEDETGEQDDAASDEAEAEEAEAEEAEADEAEEEEERWTYEEPFGVRLEKRAEWERDRDGAIRLHEAGVPFAFGSRERSPKDLLKSVREVVEAGLPREAALAALTTTPAQWLGLGGRLGRVAPGYEASFTLWSADPLTDEDARPARVYVDGYPWKADDEGEDEKRGKKKDAGDDEEEGEEEGADASDPAALADVEAGHAFETDPLRVPSIRTGGDLIVRGATIHTAVRPGFVGDILVQDGRIAAIGEGLEAPAGVHVIDGRGLHVAPGAIDAHSHMAISRGVNEGTVSISADVDMTDVVDAEDIALYRALAGGTTLIQILHGSANAIGGQAELLKLRGRGKTADEIRYEHGPKGIKFALGENPKRSNWGTPGERFPGTRLGVEAIFYRAFERAREYQAERDAYRDAKARGEDPPPYRKDIRLNALVAILEGELVVHSHCYRADEILMLMRAAEHFGFRVGTLHHVLEGYKVAAEIAAHGAGTSTFSDWWAYKIEAYDAVPGNAALLEQAGSVASIKSDSDELVRHMYHEAAKSVGYAAMDPVEALQLVTLNPAIQLGVDDRVGTLEVGKDGDLVLTSADPLSVYSKVLATFVEGECVFERRDAFGVDEDSVASFDGDSGTIEASSFSGPFTAITGATVHPADGPAIDNGVVLLSGNRIAAVGDGLGIPEGAQVIDATGQHLYPGLIALGTSLGLREIGAVRATMDAREIGGDQPDLSVASSIHADSAHLGVTRYNGITRAQSVPSGFGAIHGQSAVVRLTGDTWEEMLVRERDMLHVRFPRIPNTEGNGHGGVRPWERDEEEDEKEAKKKREKAIAVLDEKFEKAAEYARLIEEAEAGGFAPPPFEPRSAALAPFARGEGRVALHADNAATILRALRFAEEHELDAVLYGAREAWKVVDRLAESGVPVVYGPVLDLPRTRFDPYDAPYATPAVLARAGVPYAIQPRDDENPRNLPFHAGFAACFGLDADEALRAVSLYPAQILGLGDELGSLTPGKLGDLVLVDGDLFEPTSRVVGVWIDGVPASLTNRHTELYERYRERLRAIESR